MYRARGRNGAPAAHGSGVAAPVLVSDPHEPRTPPPPLRAPAALGQTSRMAGPMAGTRRVPAKQKRSASGLTCHGRSATSVQGPSCSWEPSLQSLFVTQEGHLALGLVDSRDCGLSPLSWAPTPRTLLPQPPSQCRQRSMTPTRTTGPVPMSLRTPTILEGLRLHKGPRYGKCMPRRRIGRRIERPLPQRLRILPRIPPPR
jgi:hypothetical protein